MTSLILLLVVSLLAVGSVRLSMTGMRVAVNAELRMDAFHHAQSLIDAALSIPANTAVAGVAGVRNCLPSVSGCELNTLALPQASGADYKALADSGTSVAVRRLAPERAPPPRLAGYSAVRFESAYLQVESTYNDPTGGHADLNEGVAVILPMPGG